MVKFGMIAGAGNVVIFNRISAPGECEKYPWRRGRLRFAFSGSAHARIFSDHVVGSVAHWKCHFSCFQ